eukprot:10524809-Alexandrium_andersonii.AAC.1
MLEAVFNPQLLTLGGRPNFEAARLVLPGGGERGRAGMAPGGRDTWTTARWAARSSSEQIEAPEA